MFGLQTKNKTLDRTNLFICLSRGRMENWLGRNILLDPSEYALRLLHPSSQVKAACAGQMDT
jgi:hypothetical protein